MNKKKLSTDTHPPKTSYFSFFFFFEPFPYVKVSGDSKGLSFCLKKLILRLWAAQNCPPSNQIPVTHNTKGFQGRSCHTAPPGGQKVQNVSLQARFESATLKITSNYGATMKIFTLCFSLLLFLLLPIYMESPRQTQAGVCNIVKNVGETRPSPPIRDYVIYEWPLMWNKSPASKEMGVKRGTQACIYSSYSSHRLEHQWGGHLQEDIFMAWFILKSSYIWHSSYLPPMK